MQVILTPTAVANMFGPGLHGFAEMPVPTQLSAEWFNHVQMELANAILDQGVALDSMNLGQLTIALNSWKWSGSPTLLSGATLIANDGSTIEVQTNGTLVTNLGSVVQFNGSVTIGASATFTCESLATFNGNVVLGNAGTDTVTIVATTETQGSVNVKSAMSILGADGGGLASDPTATLQWNGTAEFTGRLKVLTGTSIAEGDLSKDGSGNFRYHDAASTKFVNTSASGYVKGYAHTELIAATATATLDTPAVAPKATADLDVSAEFWVRRAVAGDVTISLIEVGGAGQIGTNTLFNVTATGGSNWNVVTFCRRRSSADTTPRAYRLEVYGGGSNVTLANVRVTVTPAS